MTSLWKLLQVEHIKKIIAEDWGLVDGIYMPKEKNSKHLEQFRPISLLNVEGKIFVLNNKFINISIQKAGIPSFPGCIEYASMLWERNKSAELHVIWLWSILTFDPARHAIPKTAKVHIPSAWASLADKMGQSKIPRYSHKLMHRKRVTCELHDSYFRSMTIKHAIPRTAEVTHPDGQLWGDIEWAIELLYNSVKFVWRPEKLQTRCGRESQHSAESWAPDLRLSNPRERKRHNADGHKSGGQYVAVLFGLQLPLTRNLSNKVRGIFLKKSSLVFLIVSLCSAWICI